MSYRDAVDARLTTLRNFLLVFSLIDLGARLEWLTMGSTPGGRKRRDGGDGVDPWGPLASFPLSCPDPTGAKPRVPVLTPSVHRVAGWHQRVLKCGGLRSRQPLPGGFLAPAGGYPNSTQPPRVLGPMHKDVCVRQNREIIAG